MIEAVGLFILLASWFFNWMSTEYWGRASQELEKTAESAYTRYHSLQVTANIASQPALSRALQKQPGEDGFRITEGMWNQSAELRFWRLTLLSNNFVSQYGFLEKLRELNVNYSLGKTDELTDLSSQLSAAGNSIAVAAGLKEFRDYRDIKTPSIESLSFASAGQLDKELTKSIESINNISDQMQTSAIDQKARVTFCYYVLFVIGSCLTVTAKVFEWLSSR